MEFARPLIPGRLIRRYKRFLADVTLEDGQTVTAHCANTGAMLGVQDPGSRVWIEPNDDPKRKLKYSWKLIELPGGALAGIDTGVPNRVAGEALRNGKVETVQKYEHVRAEVKYAQNSRVDFLLTADALPDCYVEVKNVHLRRESDWAEFPDSVTTRGAKHLGDLAAEVQKGHRAVLLYVVQRDDCRRVKMARDLDPNYAERLCEAARMGVEV
ncbi:MAG: DNA/RNA nuclease SfsA, partial [Pseudomonadota bacterium]